MDKINNFIYYLILLLLFGFCTYFLHSRCLLVIFVAMVAFPLLSYIAMKSAANKLTLTLSTDDMWNEKGKELILKLGFKNKSLFPVINCIVTFGVENRFYPNDNDNVISLSIPAKGECCAEIPITPIYNGLVNIKIEDVEIRDYLNIFSRKNIKSSDYHFFVIPNAISDSSEIKRSELYSEDSLLVTKNANGTQIDGIRDYIIGDKLKNIHWKLSAKKQDLLVKEYSDNNEESAILLAELYSPAIDDIIDNVYGMGRQLLKEGYPFTLAFAAAGNEQLTKICITEKTGLRDSMEKIFLAYPSENDKASLYALRREYAGSGIIYIHGDKNKAVTEIV